MSEELFSERLRMLRKQCRLTQQQVADRLSLHRTTYTKYETGVVAPDREALVRLSELFGVSVDYLVGREAEVVAVAEGSGEVIHLSLQEQKMLQMYRQLTYAEQQELLQKVQKSYQARKKK